MINKFIEVMDKLSNITSLKDKYKFHWFKAPYIVIMSFALAYVVPKSGYTTYIDYWPAMYIFLLAVLGGMSLATRR